MSRVDRIIEKFYQLSVSDILTPWSEVNTWSLDVVSKVQACKALTLSVSVTVEKACFIACLTEDMVQEDDKDRYVSPLYVCHYICGAMTSRETTLNFKA